MFNIKPEFAQIVKDFCKAQSSATDIILEQDLFDVMQKQGLIREWGNMPYFSGARVHVDNTRSVILLSESEERKVSLVDVLEIDLDCTEHQPDFVDTLVREAVDISIKSLPTDAYHQYRVSNSNGSIIDTSKTTVVLFREAIAHACVQNSRLTLKGAWFSAVETRIMKANEQAQFPRGQWTRHDLHATYSSSSVTGIAQTAKCDLLYLILCDALGIRSFNYSEQNNGSITADDRVTQMDLFIEYLYARIAYEVIERRFPKPF